MSRSHRKYEHDGTWISQPLLGIEPSVFLAWKYLIKTFICGSACRNRGSVEPHVEAFQVGFAPRDYGSERRLDSIGPSYNDTQVIHNISLYFAFVLTEVNGVLVILSLFLITPKVN